MQHKQSVASPPETMKKTQSSLFLIKEGLCYIITLPATSIESAEIKIDAWIFVDTSTRGGNISFF